VIKSEEEEEEEEEEERERAGERDKRINKWFKTKEIIKYSFAQ
jgi:hypothetical protein